MSTPLSLEQEQLIHRIVASLLTPAQAGECKCHWIDANKTPILLWKSAKDPDTFVLKIGQQKLIGLIRSDKKNEMYWKFRNVDLDSPAPATEPPAPTKPSESPPPNQVQLESAAVEKFKEKYGTANQPKA